jgi:SAM-dependent methyltransferase
VTTVTEGVHLAGTAFDSIAESYDSLFTRSLIGRAQRSEVWKKVRSVFRAGDHVLELNCGTGVDAMFLASLGVRVTACDASAAMIEQAQARKSQESPSATVDYRWLCTERLHELSPDLSFNGVFSNFSGLNCLPDISSVANFLAARLTPGAQLLLCFSTRFCAWEMLHYLGRGEPLKAIRRCRGSAEARMGAYLLPVYYPTVGSIRRSFGSAFRLRSLTGIGVAVPPTYMEAWSTRNPSLFRACQTFDRVAGNWPGLRVLGDHMLLHLERV